MISQNNDKGKITMHLQCVGGCQMLMKIGSRVCAQFAILSLGLLLMFGVLAQEQFPQKPIRLILGYPPGGSADFVARITADAISKELNVNVLVDNKPGAGGSIATDILSKTVADGYTIGLLAPHAQIKALFPKLGFDPDKELLPVSKVSLGTMIIVVHNKTPFNTLQDLITYAKANPDKLFNASSGNGSSPHLASALFESAAGVKFATIQFKGGGAAAQSTIVGDTQVMFATPATVMGFLKSGMLRPISLTSSKRSDAIPGIPSALEGGLKNYNMDFSYGIYVPKGTPDAVIKRLFDATTKGLLQAGVKERFAVQGLDISPSKSTEDFIAELKQEAPSIYRAVKESGAKVE